MSDSEIEQFLDKKVSLCFENTPSIWYSGYLERESSCSEKMYRLHWNGVRPFPASAVKSIYKI